MPAEPRGNKSQKTIEARAFFFAQIVRFLTTYRRRITMSFAPALTQTSRIKLGRTGRIALWAVKVVLALMFLLAGSSKLMGAAAMAALFDAIGISQWLRYVTGVIALVSSI